MNRARTPSRSAPAAMKASAGDDRGERDQHGDGGVERRRARAPASRAAIAAALSARMTPVTSCGWQMRAAERRAEGAGDAERPRRRTGRGRCPGGGTARARRRRRSCPRRRSSARSTRGRREVRRGRRSPTKARTPAVPRAPSSSDFSAVSGRRAPGSGPAGRSAARGAGSAPSGTAAGAARRRGGGSARSCRGSCRR